MIVVFDTTVLFPDLFAEGLNWTLLRDFRNNRNVSLVVPQIVLVPFSADKFRVGEEFTRDR